MTSGDQTQTQTELADRPRRGADPRLKTSATLVAIPGVAAGGTTRLLNLSTTGACVELEDEVQAGQSLELKLAHPNLKGVPCVTGEVMWLNEVASGKSRIGLQFLEPTQAGLAVRPFLTAEAGSCLFQDQQLVGFVVPHGKANKAWSLFDASGKRLAVAARDETGYEVRAKTQRAGSLPSFHVSSLYEATCRAVGVGEPLRLDPAIPSWRPDPSSAPSQPAEPAEPSQPGAALSLPVKDALGRPVSGPAGPLGYLCETVLPDSWVLVDQQGKQVAYLASSDTQQVQICSMGDAIDDELEFQAFPDLNGAVAAVFQLGARAGELEIGELVTVGHTTPIRVQDSESSVDLDQDAIQVTLKGYPSLQGPPPPPRPRAVPRPAANSTPQAKRARPSKSTKRPGGVQQQSRRAIVIGAGITAMALTVFVLHALWTLIQTYAS